MLSVPSRWPPPSVGAWFCHFVARSIWFQPRGAISGAAAPAPRIATSTTRAASVIGWRARRRSACARLPRERTTSSSTEGAGRGASTALTELVVARPRVEPRDGELAEEREHDEQRSRHEQQQLECVGIDRGLVRVDLPDEERSEPVQLKDPVDGERRAEDRAEVGQE